MPRLGFMQPSVGLTHRKPMTVSAQERRGAQPHLPQRTRKSWFKTWELLGLKNLWVQLKLGVLSKPESQVMILKQEAWGKNS